MTPAALEHVFFLQALELVQPAASELLQKLGPHELSLSAVGLHARVRFDLFLKQQVEDITAGLTKVLFTFSPAIFLFADS